MPMRSSRVLHVGASRTITIFPARARRILMECVEVDGSGAAGASRIQRRFRPPKQNVATMMEASRKATGMEKKRKMYQKVR